MPIVGYLQGTDPHVLTKLVVRGYETLPLSNGYDNNGKLVGHVTSRDDIRVVIGHLHKTIPIGDHSPKDILWNLRVHQIPVVLVVDEADRDKATELLGEMSDGVRFASADDLCDVVLSILEESN